MSIKNNGGASSEGDPRLNSSLSSNEPKSTRKPKRHQLVSGRHPAGFKDSQGGDTSYQAACKISKELGRRQAEVLAHLQLGPATPEEIADAIGRHFATVRPRVSELVRLGLVMDTGRRGTGALGGTVRIWRVATPEERAAFQAAQAEATH
jgi:hypothetical protein